MAQPYQNEPWINAVVEMMDVEFFAVFGPSNIRVHPLLNFLLSVVNATIADTTTAMPVHSTHHGWLENLHKRMVYILIRPQLWFVDDTPFSGALIIPLLLLRLGELALINSDLDISDVRSMCCRLRLDLSELRHRNGGLFGAGDSTGSIGVVTLNLPRLGYENKGDQASFYAALDKYLDIARDSLEIKRDWLQKEVIDAHMLPAYMEYVGTINNHFSTIGVIGMNEMCENFMGKNILDPEAKQFCVDVGNHIRARLLVYQEETGHLYNYEATPAESTCYRFALADRKIYPDIITQGSGLDCYYTNSCHIPVSMIDGIDSTFKHQEDLQTQFTGGTVIHVWEEGAITGEQAKAIVKAMCENYRVPYMSLSPISRYCDEHGYIPEKVDKCPYCKQRLKKYQRITGYLRCVDNFNRGKKAEFSDRVQL